MHKVPDPDVSVIRKFHFTCMYKKTKQYLPALGWVVGVVGSWVVGVVGRIVVGGIVGVVGGRGVAQEGPGIYKEMNEGVQYLLK